MRLLRFAQYKCMAELEGCKLGVKEQQNMVIILEFYGVGLRVWNDGVRTNQFAEKDNGDPFLHAYQQPVSQW